MKREPDASIMEWVFSQLEKGIYSTEQVFHAALEKGLACSKNNFYSLIISGILDSSDFKEIKAESLKKIESLEVRISGINLKNKSTLNANRIKELACTNILDLSNFYHKADISEKRDLLNNLIKDRILFDGNRFQDQLLNLNAKCFFFTSKSKTLKVLK